LGAVLVGVAIAGVTAPEVSCAHDQPVDNTATAPALSGSDRPTLDSRVRKLAKILQLSDSQQIELAKVLASRREQIRRLWSEQTVAPEFRVSAMQAINDKTDEQIRGLLNDEQKERYRSVHPPQTPGTSQQSTLDYWLNASAPKPKN
jgi:hypothetical protein